MVGSVRSCCVPKCGKTHVDNTVLHAFPHPEKEKERFASWVNAVGSSLSSLDHYFIYKNRKVCKDHFEERYLTWTRRLCSGAVPTLHVPGVYDPSSDHNYFASSSKDPAPTSVIKLEFQMDTYYPTRSTGKQTMLEVCVDSLESAINAIHGGADELEVCSSLTEAGLTPSPGLVKQIREMVDNIAKKKPIRKSCDKCACDSLTKAPKINIMIRCRTGSDFHYSREEMDTMLYDIDVFKDSGIDRFVFGALTDTQDIDEMSCTKIINRAHPIPVTFHRAFDVCKDPKKAIVKIIELGFDRLLTSGQKPVANEKGAIALLTSLIKSHGDKIQIMPGAGVTLGNVNTFIGIGCEIVHSSCKFIRYLPQIKDSISMGITDGEYIYVTVEDTVRKMKNILSGEANAIVN